MPVNKGTMDYGSVFCSTLIQLITAFQGIHTNHVTVFFFLELTFKPFKALISFDRFNPMLFARFVITEFDTDKKKVSGNSNSESEFEHKINNVYDVLFFHIACRFFKPESGWN